MKLKNHFRFLLLFLGFLAFTNVSYAKYVVLTGNAYGDQIGLIHFDYKTAKNPDPANAAFNAAKYYVGPTKQFNISPYDAYFLNPAHPFTPGSSDIVSKISTDSADCVNNNCYLQGFAWSDKIGWIALNGSVLGSAIADNGGSFPANWYPKISTNETADKRLALTGFAWNEYTGWIMLSSDATGNTGVTADSDAQTDTSWGLWLDGGMEPDRVDVPADPSDPTVTNSVKLGRAINGFAWSEKLGWIKFSKTPSDTIDFKTYTLWMPDKTPPIPLAPDKLWFAAGVNTHYPDITKVPQNIAWNEFAIDPESGINYKDSKIFITSDNCSAQIPPVVGKMTYPLPTAPVDYTALGSGDILRLILPGMATVKNVQSGYCKYQVSAEIWNDVNNVIYLGDHFIPNPAPDPKLLFPAVTVYVRAGDYADKAANPLGNVEVTSDNHTGLPQAYADGAERIRYTVNFSDIAGNPIIDVDCGSPSSSYYLYDGCPGRKAVVTANVTNQLLYDLTQPLKTQVIRPVFHGDGSPSSSVAFTENDGNSPSDIGVWTASDSSTLSWPVQKFNTGNQWDVQINRAGGSNFNYALSLTSFAPSGTFALASLPPPLNTHTYNISINSFSYKIYNEKLPETSKELIVPLPSAPNPPQFKSENTSSITLACYDDGDAVTLPACANPPILPTTVPGPRAATPGLIANPLTAQLKLAIFNPPVITNNGSLTGTVGSDVLTMSTPAKISFDILNVSSSDLTSANNSGLAIDNIFQFTGSASAALMDAQRISNETPLEPDDTYLGWSDPFEYGLDSTRYEMYMKNGQNYAAVGDPPNPIVAKNSPFVDLFKRSQSHPNSRFYYSDSVLSSEINTSAPAAILNQLPQEYKDSEIDNDGRYYITGLAGIPHQFNPIDPAGDLTNPFNYNPGYIDHSDSVNLDLPATTGKQSKVIQFYPEKLISDTLSSLKFNLIQEIAYRFPKQIQYTVYASTVPLINNIETKDVGLEATGTVIGQQIVTGRQFDVVGSASTQKLQEQVRRNVAEMTAGIDTKCPIPSAPLTAFDTVDDIGDCVTKDSVNGTMFAYYEGGPSEILTLGDGNDLTVPNIPYTIVIKGGASVFIKSNIAYDPANKKSSFGIILIAGNPGKNNEILGTNIYISPDPTNITAVVYTEGSIMSRSNTGNLYYGGSSESIAELANQLYWRGSIASRNSIAGAGIQKIPVGAICTDGGTTFSCAQRYDLDYLRRFTTVIDKTTGDSQIANNGKFSGGGTCTAGSCVMGTNPFLPSVVTLDPATGHIIENKSELSTVFVTKDPNTTNNPPPGFTLTTGLETNQEIR